MKTRKLLAVLVTLAMVFSLIPTTALAAEPATALPEPVDGVITLTEDVTLTESVTLNEGTKIVVPAGKTVTLDLNGYTISQEKACTGHYAMITNNGSLTITGNGKLSFTDTSTSGFSVDWGSYTVYNYGTLVVESGTIENLSTQNAGNGDPPHIYFAISQYSGSTAINGGTISTPYYRSIRVNGGTLTVNDGTFEGQIWMQPSGNGTSITIKNGSFTPLSGDGSSVFVANASKTVGLSVLGGTFNGKIGCDNAPALAGSITGGKFTESAKNGTNAALLAENYAFGTLVDGYYTVADSRVAAIGDTKYATLQGAIDAAEDGDTVTLLSDVTLTEGVTIPADADVTLDLNGYTISQTKEQTGAYQMILNDGNLTIEDNSTAKTGTISYTDSGNGGEYISDTIYNLGVLVINGGTIENLSSATVASNGYPHAVDTYSGSRNTSVTINGGTIYCAEYSAIRMFCASATNKADLVINEGATIQGAVDMQNGSKNVATKGSLTINGGTFTTTANANNIRFANWNGDATEYGITASIKGGSFSGGITTQYVPTAADWNKKIVTGGTFSEDPSDYVPSTHQVTQSGDNYVVSAKPAPAPSTGNGGGGGGGSTSTTTTPTAPTVPESSKPNTSSPTTSTETKTDTTTGSTTTTETKQDGTKVETTTNKDGSSSTTATKTETTTNKDGSTTTTTATNTSTTTATGDKVTEEKVEAKVENKDGSTTTTTATNTSTETASGDKVTEEKVEQKVENKDGSTTTTTTTTTETTTASGEKVTVKAEEKVEATEDKTTTTTTTETKSTETGTTVTEKTVAETVKNEDGTETTTSKTDTKSSDGSSGTTTVAADGTTTAEVTVSTTAVNNAEKAETAVALPMPAVEATKTTETAPTITVDVPANTGSVKVEIPVADVNPGTVVVIVDANGNETIVPTTTMTENGVTVTVEGDVTVKVVDNSKGFEDVAANSTFSENIDFVSARGIVTGTTATTFEPNEETTRGQVMTMLARTDGADTTGAPIQKGMEWAVEAGISDGTNASNSVTRQQLATMLWRYAGEPTSDHKLSGPDADSVSSYAEQALAWCIENGIMTGYGDGTLKPTANASRAHVAAMIARFIQLVG